MFYLLILYLPQLITQTILYVLQRNKIFPNIWVYYRSFYFSEDKFLFQTNSKRNEEQFGLYSKFRNNLDTIN